MPAFVIEFDSNYGPERRLFTLDGDRALRVQMVQVLEELRLADRVLVGGPADELGVYWNGEELDQTLALESLGISTERPLVLRMRPRVAAAKAPPPKPLNWTAILRPPLEGAMGALLAWFAGRALSDLRAPLSSVDAIDLVAATLLAGGIGIAIAIGSVARRELGVAGALPIVLGAPLTGGAALLGLLMIGQAPSAGQFILGRMVAWALILALLSLLITAPRRSLPSSRWATGLAAGALSGIVSALTFSLPGPSLIWQALAFLIAGLGVGAGAVAVPTWQALTRDTATTAAA